ncbi:hypothetical protein BB561_001693 [Smittium simulii]|uniref:Aspartic peptidase DDI1-type domain-containing protein n=1 Tax=Smittium simulii TaxID=133385 RepID=A0A2T9YTE0_9FUNG|nr:hypothetical protein BB561_001693 [Smittium simulii]
MEFLLQEEKWETRKLLKQPAKRYDEVEQPKVPQFSSKYKRPSPVNLLLVGQNNNNSDQMEIYPSQRNAFFTPRNKQYTKPANSLTSSPIKRANKIAQISPTPKQSYINDASPLKPIQATHGVTGSQETQSIIGEVNVNDQKILFTYDLGAALTVISMDLAKNLGLEIEWENKRIVKTASEDNITVYRCPQVNLKFETFTSK